MKDESKSKSKDNQAESVETVEERNAEKEGLIQCDICGEYHEKHVTHGFIAKGKRKYICNECADSVHGLV